MPDLTPMARQYQEMKALHKDAILFFRLGDFYEMFYGDAELAARELDLTLTGRGKDDNRMPMCGVPYHAAEGYIAKLIEKGYKVAICEQVEDPKLAKGLVKRDIIRIVTPGTILESSMLSEKTNNYLMAVNHEKGAFGLAFVDATTGEFKLTDFASVEQLNDEVRRINPAEVLVSDMFKWDGGLKTASTFKDVYDNETAVEKLLEHFKVKSLEAFGLTGRETALGAAAAILDYLKETQKTTLGHINVLKLYHTADYMFIDGVTRRNLELTQTARDKSLRGSLLWVLDRTRTSMGARLLKQWLLQPLLDAAAIERRLDAVAELFHNGLLRSELGEGLKKVFDIERLTGKAATQTANARDLAALKDSLKQLPKLRSMLKDCRSSLLKQLDSPHLNVGNNNNDWEKQIIELISRAVVDDPPFVIKEGGLIKSGYNAELDELKKATGGGKQWLAELEASERQRTGIKSLKVGFTKVFGYFIEVTNSNLDQVPPDYIRKQTLVNGERFITPGLKEKETLILNAAERMKELEYELLVDLRKQVASYTKELQAAAAAVAQTDVLLSLAEAAVENRYCRPVTGRGSRVAIKDGRHPVVEKTLGEFQFVPNDVILDEKQDFLLITGPNMGGKSTYMRQAALICLLAQIGSFVPAKSAELGLIDRIFTRIGAMDDIYAGQSTFMVEMTETANIINNATEKSLIILDEIGRGTATFDGMSIAAAVAEYIHARIKAKTLFATHYHEITQLADKHPGIKNINVSVREEGDKITFLHKVADGPADRSYGIQVAKLAGLPEEVVKRSKEIYNTLAMVENDLGKVKSQKSKVKIASKKSKVADRDQVSLF
ncbi:MAG: DNA mismatch repair protein MutS [Candidatus Saganbacteria bacterium]|nr:DNA mismatch repair protein MutS [Candidatus Saganbacteria bacterium]